MIQDLFYYELREIETQLMKNFVARLIQIHNETLNTIKYHNNFILLLFVSAWEH